MKGDVAAAGAILLGINGPKMDFLKDGISIIAGICGIIFVIASIRHKNLEIQRMRNDAKSKTNREEN